MAHNSDVDERTGGATPGGQTGAPLPVPELPASHGRDDQPTPGGRPPGARAGGAIDPTHPVQPASLGASGLIDGADREAYARLLDRARARGLLSPTEHQLRLAELADAGSVAEMQRIVTDLPALNGVNASAPRSPVRSDRHSTGLAAWPGAAGYRASRRRAAATPGSRPWTLLAVLIIVVVLVFALLVVYADRVVHQSHVESGSLPVAAHVAPATGTA